MAAKLECYTDAECTNRLTYQTNSYYLTLGPAAGLDGDGGEVYTQSIWVKNVGDYPALGATVIKVGDTNKYVYTTTAETEATAGHAPIGDLAIGEIKEVKFTTAIPRYTKLTTVDITIRIDYYTHP